MATVTSNGALLPHTLIDTAAPTPPFAVDSIGYAAWWFTAKLGWRVFPVHAPTADGACSCGHAQCQNIGKHPRTPNGFDDATTDPAQIIAWWKKWPDANIGLACGASGLVALDFDTAKPDFAGQELLDWLLANYPTTAARSGSGGWHLLYRQPALALGDSRGALPRRVDMKGKGYIVLAPSLHQSGNRYRWEPGYKPHLTPPAPMPADIVALIQRPKSAPSPTPAPRYMTTAGGDDVEKARGWLERLAPWRVDDYDVDGGWVAVGMALSELGGAGLALWEDWSKRSPKYTPVLCDRKWATFKPGAGKRLGSLKYWADQDDPTGATPRLVYTNGSDPTADAATLALITSDPAPDAEPEGPHPLDTHPKTGLQLGWIDDYADLMTRMTGAPREFNLLAGLVVAATAIQRRARLRMSFGDIYPNVYAAVIAPSSVYHKSSALAKPRAILQRAMLDNLLLSELMTSEGLLKQLQGQSAGLVLRDEIGTLFASHNTKYLANLKPDLTALFDCYPYSRRLSNDDIKVQSPYLNILGATTPSRFFEGVSYLDWQDGFLARWLFVMPEKEPDFDAMTGLFTQEHDASVGALAIPLMNIDRQRETDFELVTPSFKLWDGWQRQAAKDAYYYGDDVTAAIVTRYAAYALKFAMILASVNDSWGTITPETMQTAIHLADGFKATVYKLLSEKSNYGVSGAKLQKIFRIIKGKAGTAGITQRDIGRLCNMRKAELTPCMEKLKELAAVISVNDGKAERYIPAVERLPTKSW